MAKAGPRSTLTRLQSAFCHEYMVDMNATKAYQRAGGSQENADQLGPKLMKNPRVLAEIDRLKGKVFQRIDVTAEDIVKEAWEIARNPETPAAARVSALTLLARRHREFSEKREIDVRQVSILARVLDVPEDDLLAEASDIRALLKSGGE